MKFFTDVLHLLGRQWRLTMRMPVFLVMSIVQPILWMLLFSQLFSKAMSAGFGGGYVQFLAPGIAIMSSLFGSSYAGMGLLNDIDRGVMDRMLATPVTRIAIILARVIHTGATTMIQSAVILVVALFLGARPKSALGFFTVLAAAALLGSGMGGISHCMAILTRKQEAMFAVMNFTTLPMIYLSSTIMNKALMPDWIRTVSRYNPVDWAVTIARNGFEGKVWTQTVGEHALALIAFTAMFSFLSTQAFKRYRATM
jgi:ABC-2 type transport system permease protein